MNLAEIIRASLIHTYGNSTPSEVASSRFAAGANDAANAILDQLRGMGALELRQWIDNQIIDDEPEDERRRRLAGAYDKCGNPRASLAGVDRSDPFAHEDRITSLASETAHTARDLYGLTLSCQGHARRTTDLEETTARHEAMLTEHDGRISAVELLTHNVTELTRELRTLRATVSDHSTDLATLTGNTGEATTPAEAPGWPMRPGDTGSNMPEPTEAPHDPDQRLGGHDNPHPHESHFPTPADSDSA